MTDAPLSGLESTDAAPPESNWRPTALSVAVVAGATALPGGALAHAAGVWSAALPAVGGAVLLALGVSLASREAYRPLVRFLAACCLIPASAGVVVGVGYALARQLGGSYPVGSLFVVAGLAVAGFGAVTAVGDAFDRESLASALAVAAVASLPPAFAFVPLAAVSVHGDATTAVSVPVLVPAAVPAAALPGALAAGALRFLVAPTHDGPHLFSFALVCYVAAAGLSAVLRSYPLADLLASDDADSAARLLDSLERAAALGASLGAPAVVVAGALFALPDGFSLLPTPVLAPLTAIAGVSVLRAALLAVGAVGLALAVGSWAVRRFYGRSPGDLGDAASALGAGVAVVVVASVAHGPVLAALFAAALDVLPPSLTDAFEAGFDEAVAFYGGETVLIGLCAGLLLVAAVAFAALYATLRTGAVTDRAAGAAVAGGGLFAASAVAVTIDVWTPLALAGIVGGLVVHDAGVHGVTVGEEVGRRGDSRRADLVHLGLTLAVGVLALAFALGLDRVLGGLPSVEPGVLSVALGGTVLALLALAVALR